MAGLQVLPIAGSLGAEVEDVDLCALDDATFAEIQAALDQHLVLFFHDQSLTPVLQTSLTLRFGPLGETPFIKTLDGHPGVIEVLKEESERSSFVFGGAWHSDFSFLERPPYVTCLHAKEVPAFGGDTLYANMILAYETLDDATKLRIEGLRALHSGERAYSPKMQSLQNLLESMQVTNTDEALEVRAHPLVRTHPRTGRRGLFINPVYTVGIEGMPDDEARALLDALHRHALSEPLTCRFRWRPGSLAIWDNRFTQHWALSDYLGKRRRMHRTTAVGEVPI